MIYREISSYAVIETLRRAQARSRATRWLDRFNNLFWRLLGV